MNRIISIGISIILVLTVTTSSAQKKKYPEKEGYTYIPDSGFYVPNTVNLGNIGVDTVFIGNSVQVPNTATSSRTAATTRSVSTSTIVLQPGPEDGKDSYVYKYDASSSSMDRNFGTSEVIFANAWTSSNIPTFNRGLLEFDCLLRHMVYKS